MAAAIVKSLHGGITAAQARAIVRAIEIEVAGTRQDVERSRRTDALCQDPCNKMSAIRIELTGEIRRCFGSIGRQFIAATVAQTVLVVGYAYLFMTTIH
jgi:hypothetical protein